VDVRLVRIPLMLLRDRTERSDTLVTREALRDRAPCKRTKRTRAEDCCVFIDAALACSFFGVPASCVLDHAIDLAARHVAFRFHSPGSMLAGLRRLRMTFERRLHLHLHIVTNDYCGQAVVVTTPAPRRTDVAGCRRHRRFDIHIAIPCTHEACSEVAGRVFSANLVAAYIRVITYCFQHHDARHCAPAGCCRIARGDCL
jgi:hypothetical protein